MKAKLVPIGNSKGIRIPQTVLDQCHFSTEGELEVRGNSLVVRPLKATRKGWAKAFRANAWEWRCNADANQLSKIAA
jgi:antitoxin MazE